MSLDGNYDPFDPNNQNTWGTAGQQGNPNWNVAPTGANNSQSGGGANLFGYNPSTDMVQQNNIDAYSQNPQSFMGGWSPPANLTPNVFGTNEFNGSQPYSAQGTSSTSPANVNAGVNNYFNPTSQAGLAATATGTPGGSTGGSSTGGATGGATGGTGGNPDPTGGSSGGKGGGFEQTVWSDPSNFYLNYNRQMANMGVNPASGTPMAQMMQRAASRSYADYMARGLAGDTSLSDTSQAIGDFMARGGREAPGSGTAPSGATGAGVTPAQNLRNLFNQLQSGGLTSSDPRWSTVQMLRDNPTIATQMFANLGPQTPGSRYQQQYLQDAANYNQVNGQATPRNYLDALLMAFGV